MNMYKEAKESVAILFKIHFTLYKFNKIKNKMTT